MYLTTLFLPLLLATLPTISQAKKSTKANDAIQLSNVRSLTLQSGKLTTGRRSKSVQQLTCVGGSGKGRHEVDVMQCKNSGSEYDAEDIQWTCQASLPPEFKLGSTEVVCEGYDSPNDPFVLKGSCGVEYRLILTDVGEEKYGGGTWGRNKYSYDGHKSGGGTRVMGFLFQVLFWVVFIGVIGIFLYKIFDGDARRGLDGPNRRPGFWGGGGGGGDDPPPPYTPRSPPRGKSHSSYASNSSNASSGPGWAGAGLAGAAGYAAGNYMGRRQDNNRHAAPPTNYGGGGGGSWFGGGGGGGAGPSTYGAAGPSTAPSTSRYESTGFGGTRRR